ncbi:unnamed protein product [Heterobilharzia americana]|nr:unnamed protein product [Heterobilharzia americana]
MALLKCDRTQDVPLITQKSETLADFSFSTYTHEFHPLSANGSLRGKCKEITGNEIPFSLTTNVLSRSVLLQGNKCVDRTVEFTPSAKRLHMSCSASVSPKKSMTISKRQGRSQSSSPYGKLCSRTLADTSNDSNFIRLHKSNGNDWTTSDSSPTVTSPNIFSDGAFDFTMCDQCSELRTTSLDSWMDHLGQSHPLPLHWPSSRAANLNEHEKKYPYTTVIGSNKKRKATAIPRPLNSFMIFAQYLRRIVLHWFPDAPNVHISQRVGQLWRKLDSKMRHKYIDEAYRLQQLHAIEFPDYKYQPKKRTRVGNGTVNNNENDELISKSENVPIKSKSVTLSNNNNDSKCSPVNYENIKFSISQNCFTRLNHREYNDDHHPHHTPSAPQKLEETNIRSATCNRDYFQSCLQLNNKLNIELQQSMVGCVSDQYDTRVFLSPNLKDSLIFKENKEINETMTLLVSDGDKVENGVTYQLHKIIPCHTIDGVAPSSLNYGSQIKEIRIVNMQSPTVQQVLNKQPILCHTVLCEPLKTTVIRRPTIVPIRTNTSVLNGLLLDANLNNPNFQPITTQSTVTVTPSLSSNSSSIIGLDYNIPHSDSTSEIEFENVHSQYTSISNKHKSNVINYSSEG